MSQNHPYRNLQVPSDVPFELKPASPRKGWGVFAIRPIKRGSAILKEKPLFIIREHHGQIEEKDVRMAFQQLSPSAKQQFLYLRYNACAPFTHMLHAFGENCFAIKLSNNELQANTTPMYGLFLIHSRFNHSCIPNSKVPPTKDADEMITSYAIRDIMRGEELTICYNMDFEPRNRYERHRELRFVCDCKACLISTPFQQLSDLRRTFIRGLRYLRFGVDLDEKKQSSASPLIIDPN